MTYLPNREIKFRVWRYDQKRMFNHDWLTSSNIQYDALFDSNRKDINVMQFTGLKDSEGTEIYDGDKLQDSSGYIWIVYWNEDHACYGWYSEVNKVKSEIIDNLNTKVIGNIFHP